jgi:hypothetical protein
VSFNHPIPYLLGAYKEKLPLINDSLVLEILSWRTSKPAPEGVRAACALPLVNYKKQAKYMHTQAKEWSDILNEWK